MKINKILIIILTLSLMILSVNADSIDDKNEIILTKVLNNEGINVENVIINSGLITVSINVEDAENYDNELIGWWGLIFGYSSKLTHPDKTYTGVVIENLLNKELIASVGNNFVVINQYLNDEITDDEFWEDSIISSQKVTEYDLINSSFYSPTVLLEDKTNYEELIKKENMDFDSSSISFIWILIILIVLILIFFIYKHPEKSKESYHKTKQKSKEFYNKKGVHIVNNIRKHSKKSYEKGKKFLNKKNN